MEGEGGREGDLRNSVSVPVSLQRHLEICQILSCEKKLQTYE